MIKPVLLIPHYFSYAKYHPGSGDLPYEATGAKLRDEIAKRTDAVEVVLAGSRAETEREIARADYLVAHWITPDLLARATRLRWIQAASAGMDHFYKLSDLGSKDFRRRGVMLSNAGGVTRIVIAEQVLAYMLMFSRGMHRAMRQQVARRWEIFSADELYGRTAGVIGLGGIGQRVARLCHCLGMRVIGTKRDPASYDGPADEVLPAAEYGQVLRRADYVVLACPLSEATRGMINADTLRLMKPTACLINIGRGELVVERDLIAALKAGAIAGAGLDTFGPPPRGRTMSNLEQLGAESELWDLPNVIITPNHASGTPRAFEYLAEIVAENCRCLAAGREPKGRYV